MILTVFSFNNLSAQEEIGNNSKPVIIIQGGIEIYSNDADFNKQIRTNKVVIQDADQTLISQGKDNSLIIVSSGKKHKNSDFSPKNQIVFKDKKKNDEAQKELKKEITKYESRKKALIFKKLKVFPSSEKFAVVSHHQRDYIVPSTKNHDFSNIHTQTDQYIIKFVLDFFDAKKYISYNNKSLDFCFSKVFSVRPPPSILL